MTLPTTGRQQQSNALAHKVFLQAVRTVQFHEEQQAPALQQVRGKDLTFRNFHLCLLAFDILFSNKNKVPT